MVFSSILFLFAFLPAVLTAFFVLPKRYRYVMLLAANLFFYAWGEGRYVLLLIFFIIVNYIFGLVISRQDKGSRKSKMTLALAIILDLLILVFYKYGYFLYQNIAEVLSAIGINLNFVVSNKHLPIGISFFTFQAISYLVDVYRGEIKASANLFNFALYKSFFPQLIAGPIVRYKDVAEQFESKPKVRPEDFLAGIQRFITGLGKKVIIANTMAVVADQIFGLPTNQLSFGAAWLGALCYSIQIYFDFSGYSDMAIGLGRMFGFKFLENFNYPYIASSIRDFWRRWHISLSTWFRDYLYIPLGGSRVTNRRIYLNQMIVFLLCGLWHGPSWSFVVWGGWHGFFLILEKTGFGGLIKKTGSLFCHIYTLLVVTIGWVLFRANTLSQAIGFLKAMFGGESRAANVYPVDSFLNSETIFILIISILLSLPLASIIKRIEVKRSLQQGAGLVFYLLVFVYSIILLSSSTYNPFIYFRF